MKTSTVYIPSGKAREYSPLALNIYNGCDHGCKYCYVPNIVRKTGKSFMDVSQRSQLLIKIENDCRKLSKNKQQVLLSFTGDPYCHYNDESKQTRAALEILLKYKLPVAILTKGGSRCLQDLDIFKKFRNQIKIGATLTITDEQKVKEMEPGAATITERLETLGILYEAGIKTWVSIEPVIYPDQSLKLMELTMPFVNQFKVGKLNHYEEQERKIDWHLFVKTAVELLRSANKQFYIKQDLAAFKNDFELTTDETNMDYLTLNYQPRIEDNQLF